MDGTSESDDVGDGLQDGASNVDMQEKTNTRDGGDGQSNNNDDDGNGNIGSPKSQGNLAVEVESSAAIVDGESEKKKRPFDGGDIAASATTANNNPHKNKRQKRGRHSNSNSQQHHPLDESSTLDDISTMDAASYLAWVNQQAKALPNVFVANEDGNGDNDTNTNVATEKSASEVNTTPPKTGENEEDVVHETVATVQMLLSKRMDILPPPTVRHLPPCQITVDSERKSSQPVQLKMDDGETLQEGSAVKQISTESTASSCQQWVSDTISNFSKLRSYLEREYVKQKQKQQQSQRPMIHRKISVPRMKDRAAWHIFCLGREEAHGNVGGYYEDDGDDVCGDDGAGNSKQLEGKKDGSPDAGQLADATEDATKDRTASTIKEVMTQSSSSKSDSNNTSSSKQEQLQIQKQQTYDPSIIPTHGYPPSTSLLLQFDQVLTRMLFHHHVHYLCEWKFPLTQPRAMWIYALLARMEKPWHREECCAVRSVLRECCGRRAELKLPLCTLSANDGKDSTRTNNSGDDKDFKAYEQLALLNTLITITGIYYEQGAHAGGDGMVSLFSVLGRTR